MKALLVILLATFVVFLIMFIMLNIIGFVSELRDKEGTVEPYTWEKGPSRSK